LVAAADAVDVDFLRWKMFEMSLLPPATADAVEEEDLAMFCPLTSTLGGGGPGGAGAGLDGMVMLSAIEEGKEKNGVLIIL